MSRINKMHPYIRLVIQIVFFIFASGLFAAAFSAVRYIAMQIHDVELVQMTPFVKLLVVLLASTILFGRFFCGYACAFGSLGDWLYSGSAFLQKKIRNRVFSLPQDINRRLQYIKYMVLVGIIALCLLGYYHTVAMADPWELFASFTAGVFSVKGLIIAGILLGIILIGMCVVERFFCLFLCPLGAIFSLLPVIPFSNFGRDRESCFKGCSACVKKCPAAISLNEGANKSGACFQCAKCSIICPKNNVYVGIEKVKGTEPYLTVVKAALLFAVCYPWMNG